MRISQMRAVRCSFSKDLYAAKLLGKEKAKSLSLTQMFPFVSKPNTFAPQLNYCSF